MAASEGVAPSEADAPSKNAWKLCSEPGVDSCDTDEVSSSSPSSVDRSSRCLGETFTVFLTSQATVTLFLSDPLPSSSRSFSKFLWLSILDASDSKSLRELLSTFCTIVTCSESHSTSLIKYTSSMALLRLFISLFQMSSFLLERVFWAELLRPVEPPALLLRLRLPDPEALLFETTGVLNMLSSWPPAPSSPTWASKSMGKEASAVKSPRFAWDLASAGLWDSTASDEVAPFTTALLDLSACCCCLVALLFGPTTTDHALSLSFPLCPDVPRPTWLLLSPMTTAIRSRAREAPLEFPEERTPKGSGGGVSVGSLGRDQDPDLWRVRWPPVLEAGVLKTLPLPSAQLPTARSLDLGGAARREPHSRLPRPRPRCPF